MPGFFETQLRHALHYVNALRQANEAYKQGNEPIELGPDLLDLEWPNLQAG